MKVPTIAGVAVLLAAITAPLPAAACSAAGPDTHVGKIISVDKNAGTFTLLDAETMSAIILSADRTLLDSISGMSGSVMVTYEKAGDTLRAIELR